MIIYQASKSLFLHDALRDDIEDIVSRRFLSATGRSVGASEIQSWRHSLLKMAKVLQDEEIPADAGVAIEYQLPQSSKRIDFVITGEDAGARSKAALYAIENGRIRPSKMLIDSVAGLLQGKPEFVLIDDQKVVHETILQADARAAQRKQVVIVQGGPGTGKSVIAVNLLAALIGRGRNARYVSKNAAPRAVYEARLAGTFTKTRISNLFSGSGAFVNDDADTYDTLIVDEAHRLNEKSGLYRNLGDNQVKELIRSARCTVFFVDDDQRVTLFDIGHTEELRLRAHEFDAEVTELELSSQFRCNGSDGYVVWLDNTLDIRETANPILDTREYDFRVFDNPADLHALIELKNRANNRSRVVAGYCWKWPSKKNAQAWDIELPEFNYRRRWNFDKDGSLWIVAPASVEQVGCIHTCQGLELDYVGVIVGPDLVYRDGRIVTDATKRASSDQSVKGLKQMLKAEPDRAVALADRIVKNTYRALMTRGMKGCYVYCTDAPLAAYLRLRLTAMQETVPAEALDAVSTAVVGAPSNVVPLRQVSKEDRAAGVVAAPVIDLRFAAGTFSNAQALEDGAGDWVALPDWVRPQPGLFVAQVIGESMNRRIPNGSWCLFRANPAGTRQGKVVVVQHRSIADPETGGRYTIKVYSSEKAATEDGGWRHQRITLHPDSDQPEFEPLVIRLGDDDESFSVVAEMLMVLPAATG